MLDMEGGMKVLETLQKEAAMIINPECRRGEQTDAMGWLKLGPNVR
jgi:hypothetical protein